MDSTKLADLHTEIERLETRIRELEDQFSPPQSPPSNHSQENRIIESQSRYIEDLEHTMADMHQSRRTMEQRTRGLEDQLENMIAVDGERLRARDGRISQLEEELTTSNGTIRAVLADLNDGEFDHTVNALRSRIIALVEVQDRKINDLEVAVGRRNGRLEEYLVPATENSLTEMRKASAREVQSVKMAVNKLEALVHKAAARTVSNAE